jgi:hypothetical protein
MIRPNSELKSVRLSRFSVACAAMLVAALIGVGSPARADLISIFDQDQGNGTPPTTPDASLAARTTFLAALSNIGVENFDSNTQKVGAFPSSFNFAPTSVTATSTTLNGSGDSVTNATSNGAFATSGSNFLYNPGSTFLDVKLTFSTPITGFGVFATDFRTTDDQLQYTVTYTDNSTQTASTNATTESKNGNVLFFGVIDTNPSLLIKSIELTNTSPDIDDGFGIDDVTIGVAAVPEPSSLCLVALGLPVLLAARRLRRRRGSPPRN